MKEEIKEKFMRILFETDEEEEEIPDSSKQEEKPTIVEEKIEKVETEGSPVKAQDILYHKPQSSAFIDLQPRRSTVKNEYSQTASDNLLSSDYEFNSQISPMFGVIESKDKNKVPVEKEIIDRVTKKPINDHLDIVPSPIYGYGSSNDVINEVKETPITDTQELASLFKDEDAKFTRSEEDIDLEKEITLFDIFGDK